MFPERIKKSDYKLIEGIVETNNEHIKIWYGDQIKPYPLVENGEKHIMPSILIQKDKNATPVAHVAQGYKKTFVVQFLLNPDNENEETIKILGEVRKELNFFLIEKGEENPWSYAAYHCTTVSNVYSDVHWQWYPGRNEKLSKPPNEKTTKRTSK